MSVKQRRKRGRKCNGYARDRRPIGYLQRERDRLRRQFAQR